jgi:hypothetical protein
VKGSQDAKEAKMKDAVVEGAKRSEGKVAEIGA